LGANGVRRRLIFAVLLALIAFTQTTFAVGTATVTTTPAGADAGPGRFTKYSIAWTSTAGGAVSGNSFSIRAGHLKSVRFIPGSGGTQPSDLYDVTLTDSDGVDLLFGEGANLSNATATVNVWDPELYQDGSRTVDLVVANAGASKTGTVEIIVFP
jgi:hypothetical protein